MTSDIQSTNESDKSGISEEDKIKILESLDAIQKQFTHQSLHHTLKEDSAKLIDCRHEIVISVLAHVLAQDDINETVGTKEICKKNYHIPVPSNVDYQEYLTGFFNFLEKCMSTSAQEMNKSQPDTNNQDQSK